MRHGLAGKTHGHANRTVEKAELLAELFDDLGPVSASGFDWLREPVDVIINATSASLSGDVPPIAGSLIEPGKTFCYDMMYAKEPTAFCRWATAGTVGVIAQQAAIGQLAQGIHRTGAFGACPRKCAGAMTGKPRPAAKKRASPTTSCKTATGWALLRPRRLSDGSLCGVRQPYRPQQIAVDSPDVRRTDR